MLDLIREFLTSPNYGDAQFHEEPSSVDSALERRDKACHRVMELHAEVDRCYPKIGSIRPFSNRSLRRRINIAYRQSHHGADWQPIQNITEEIRGGR